MLKNIDFYFIRHGETKWNELQLFQGSSDSPLTSKGINQAKLAGKALKNVKFIMAYSSPQKRAFDTAKYIIGNRDIPLFYDNGIMEINFGEWEGKFVPDYSTDPNFICLENNAEQYSTVYNQGESFESALVRSKNTINKIIAQHNVGNILVVSHGSILRQLIHVLIGGKWQDHLQKTNKLENTSISIINYQQDNLYSEGQFTLKLLNQTDHLNDHCTLYDN